MQHAWRRARALSACAVIRFGITYELSEAPKSTLYLSALPLSNSGRLELPDNPRLINQICNLERKTARGGRDSIDHPIGGHDDAANCVLGLATLLVGAAAGCTLEQLKAMNSDKPVIKDHAAARERARQLHPTMSDADYARISQVGPTLEEAVRQFAEAPLWGPTAPGSVPLPGGGYAVHRTAADLQALARAADEANKGRRPANVPPLPRRTP
jgi:hypothetical protein